VRLAVTSPSRAFDLLGIDSGARVTLSSSTSVAVAVGGGRFATELEASVGGTAGLGRGDVAVGDVDGSTLLMRMRSSMQR